MYSDVIFGCKNKLKDLICFNPSLYKKYDWLVEEISQIDFKDSHYVTEVINEEMLYQSLMFKIAIFRWQNMYSEHNSGTISFEFINNFVEKLFVLKSSIEFQQYN